MSTMVPQSRKRRRRTEPAITLTLAVPLTDICARALAAWATRTSLAAACNEQNLRTLLLLFLERRPTAAAAG
jgi:hypothetical protein